MVFPVVMYGCENWTINKAERRRIDAFELWCWSNSWESLELQGDPTSPSYRKDWCWSWNSNTLATWYEELWLIGKDPDAGKDWRQEEKGMTEDEMAGWHHRLDGHGFGWTPGAGDRQKGLACCSSRVAKSQTWLSDWTELMIGEWATELNWWLESGFWFLLWLVLVWLDVKTGIFSY